MTRPRDPRWNGEMPCTEHDVLAVGCGPFNLGLAALASSVPELDLVVLDAEPELRWHPGVMFDDVTLQVSFLADLVTLVDPTHPFSFLAYLRDVDRMYPFYVRERFHPTRREYEDYLRWAAARLPSVRFSHRVESVRWSTEEARFDVTVRTPGGRRRMLVGDLVLGIGTEPALPAALEALPRERLLHTAHYLERIEDVKRAGKVTVVGSGQSGAEVALDLLQRNLDGGPALSWLTRTASFAPLDYTKLVLEMTTPAYVRYFHALPQAQRDRLVAEQWQHYKGISSDTLEAIHDLLYRRELIAEAAPVELRFGVAVESASLQQGRVSLCCRQRDTGRVFEHVTDRVIAATGYRPREPGFLRPMGRLLRHDAKGRFRVRLDHSIELDALVTGRIFVVHADLHSHGVAAPDLGICAYRNATILNTLTGRQVYPLPRRTAFTRFEPPEPRAAFEHVGSPGPRPAPRGEARVDASHSEARVDVSPPEPRGAWLSLDEWGR